MRPAARTRPGGARASTRGAGGGTACEACARQSKTTTQTTSQLLLVKFILAKPFFFYG